MPAMQRSHTPERGGSASTSNAVRQGLFRRMFVRRSKRVLPCFEGADRPSIFAGRPYLRFIVAATDVPDGPTTLKQARGLTEVTFTLAHQECRTSPLPLHSTTYTGGAAQGSSTVAEYSKMQPPETR